MIPVSLLVAPSAHSAALSVHSVAPFVQLAVPFVQLVVPFVHPVLVQPAVYRFAVVFVDLFPYNCAPCCGVQLPGVFVPSLPIFATNIFLLIATRPTPLGYTNRPF